MGFHACLGEGISSLTDDRQNATDWAFWKPLAPNLSSILSDRIPEAHKYTIQAVPEPLSAQRTWVLNQLEQGPTFNHFIEYLFQERPLAECYKIPAATAAKQPAGRPPRAPPSGGCLGCRLQRSMEVQVEL